MYRIRYEIVIGIILSLFVLEGCQKGAHLEQNSSPAVSGNSLEITQDGEVPSRQMPTQIRCELSDKGILEIWGTGELQKEQFPYADNGRNWSTIDGIKKVVLHEGISEIGNECFSYFNSVKSVDLPTGLKRIGARAFYDCVSLEQISIPDTVEEIGGHAFDKCASLEEFTLPPSLKRYKANAIKGCYRLKRLKNQSSLTWDLCLEKAMHGTWYCEGDRVDEIKSGQEVELRSDKYKITYHLNGGTATGKLPDTYSYCDGVDLPDTVEKKGYTFVGWDFSGVDGVTSYIPDGTKGNQRLRAVWMDFHVENIGGGMRVFWNLIDGCERIKDWAGCACQIRYSQNEDMSDYEFISTEYKESERLIKKLKKGKRYYIEYAVIEDLDNWETLGELPWQGKTSIVIR